MTCPSQTSWCCWYVKQNINTESSVSLLYKVHVNILFRNKEQEELIHFKTPTIEDSVLLYVYIYLVFKI